ncbi:MAG: MaoC family dehydratase [Pseudomonadota bacterium]
MQDQQGPDRRRSDEEVAPGRFRAAAGRWFEEFTLGDVYEHRPGRTITQQDNAWFTLLTMNTHPLHFDEEYAKGTEFGRPLVASPLTVAMLVGMSVSDVSQRAIANLGWKEIRLTAPVFPGDTLYAESEVIGKRESGSRPSAGIVSVRTIGRNQDGVEVCVFERTMLIPKKSAADAAASEA